MQSESKTDKEDLMILRMNDDTRIWNKIIFEGLVKALEEGDKQMAEYWKTMFI